MKYFSLFSGIGGFELGIQQANKSRLSVAEPSREVCNILGQGDNEDTIKWNAQVFCVGFSEIDKYASQIYKSHFPTHKEYGDVSKITWTDVEDFDLLVGGFPCQSFSTAGKRRGFDDTRGTLFFEIARCIGERHPRLLLLENVKGLLSHDKGNTFGVILNTLDELGYDLQWQVLNSKNFGVPQNRERVFIVGNRRGTERPNVFPLNYDNSLTTTDRNDTMRVYEKTINEKVYQMSASVSKNAKTFLLGMEQSKTEKLSVSQMQELFTEIEQGIQRGECSEVEREPQEVRPESKGNIQEIETLGPFLEGGDDTGGVCGVVSIPTEDMLILWNRRIVAENSTRRIQQQDMENDNRPQRLIKELQHREHYPLLFAVQPHQGKLFYSIGDGRDWVNVYQTKVGQICKENNLSSILEEHPDQKYFLSEKMQLTINKEIQLHRGGIVHHLPAKMPAETTQEEHT